MSRAALHLEVIRECLRSARAARTKAMELPSGPQRIAALTALGEAVEALQTALNVAGEQLRKEMAS